MIGKFADLLALPQFRQIRRQDRPLPNRQMPPQVVVRYLGRGQAAKRGRKAVRRVQAVSRSGTQRAIEMAIRAVEQGRENVWDEVVVGLPPRIPPPGGAAPAVHVALLKRSGRLEVRASQVPREWRARAGVRRARAVAVHGLRVPRGQRGMAALCVSDVRELTRRRVARYYSGD